MEIAKLMVSEQKLVEDSHLVEEYNRGALRHQRYFVPHSAETGVYEASPRPNFDEEPLPVYKARPTPNFDKQLPTYHATPSYQTQAEPVSIPDIPSSTPQKNGGRNRNRQNTNGNTQIATTHVGPEILSLMQQILASGKHLVIEFADKRRFSNGEWERFSTHEIDDMADAIGDLERCLINHNHDYIRLVGLDYKTKQPVMETLIQNPNLGNSDSTYRYPPTAIVNYNQQSSDSTFRYPDPFPHPHTAAHSYTATSNPFQTGADYHTFRDGNQHNTQIPTTHLDPQILEQMREILASGNHIGIEYVDQRRFRTGSWKSFAGHQIEDMADAIAALEACLVEHNNDYVRIFTIDPQAKRRLSEIIIQRPNGEFISRR